MGTRSKLVVRRQSGFTSCRIWHPPNLIVVIFPIILILAQAMAALSFPDNSGEEMKKLKVGERLCPVKMWYYNETGSCYPSTTQGPCPTNLLFYPQDKTYGDCECHKDVGFAKCDDGKVFSDKTVWVYDLSRNECFLTYDKAYCKSGEWLIFGDDGEPICVTNKCEEMQRKNPEENKNFPVVLYNNTCVRLSKPLGEEPDTCNLSINLESGKPMCLCNTTTYGIATAGSFKCRPGTRRDRLGKCRPINTK